MEFSIENAPHNEPTFKQKLVAALIDKKPHTNNGLTDVDQHILMTEIAQAIPLAGLSPEAEAILLEEIEHSSFEILKAKYGRQKTGDMHTEYTERNHEHNDEQHMNEAA